MAEDLLEETSLRLVTRCTTLTDDTGLGPWLFTVARNLYYSWGRSRAVDETRTSELDPAWPAPERGNSPFEAVSRAELERRLEAALARLSLRDRELLLLVGVEGLTPSEAARCVAVLAARLEVGQVWNADPTRSRGESSRRQREACLARSEKSVLERQVERRGQAVRNGQAR